MWNIENKMWYGRFCVNALVKYKCPYTVAYRDFFLGGEVRLFAIY